MKKSHKCTSDWSNKTKIIKLQIKTLTFRLKLDRVRKNYTSIEIVDSCGWKTQGRLLKFCTGEQELWNEKMIKVRLYNDDSVV